MSLKILELQQEVLYLSNAGVTIPVGYLVPKIIPCLEDYKEFNYTQEYLGDLEANPDLLIAGITAQLQLIHRSRVELTEPDWFGILEDLADIVSYKVRHGLETLSQEIV